MSIADRLTQKLPLPTVCQVRRGILSPCVMDVTIISQLSWAPARMAQVLDISSSARHEQVAA